MPFRKSSIDLKETGMERNDTIIVFRNSDTDNYNLFKETEKKKKKIVGKDFPTARGSAWYRSPRPSSIYHAD